MGEKPHYWAFLSYSHRDRRFGSWLHRALETYRVPKALVGGAVPARLNPVFRDREELAASADLGDRLVEAIDGSRNLVVICSPDAASSKWTNEEIIAFKKAHGDDHIFAAIVDGEPHASGMEGREDEECFPPALRFKIDDDGNLTDIPAEPIAADFRPQGDGKKLAKLKLIAGMLGVPLDSLVQRDAARRNKRLVWLSAASVLGMAVTTLLAIAAIQARDEARFQRGEAAGLVEFMLTDLREKLEPVGRLDTLDAVGERALAYYEKQDLEGLSEDELAQRATALNMVGEVRNLEGDLDGALEAFSQAARTTEEQLRRHPDDAERYFNHSQSSFWVGYTAWQRGDNDTARSYFEDYLRMARRMVDFEPDKKEWLSELSYAHTNVAVVDQKERKHRAALRQLEASEAIERRLLAAEPDNRDRQMGLAQVLAWQSNSHREMGNLDLALALRASEFDVYQAMFESEPDDVQPLMNQIVSKTASAIMMLEQGEVEPSLRELESVEAVAERLITHDSSNTLWREVVASFWRVRGEALMVAGRLALSREALNRTSSHCAMLVAEDDTVGDWRIGCVGAVTWRQAVLTDRLGDKQRARALAARFKSNFSNDGAMARTDIRFGHVVLAMRGLIEGGNKAAARLVEFAETDRDAPLSAARERMGLEGRRVGAYPIEKLLGPQGG